MTNIEVFGKTAEKVGLCLLLILTTFEASAVKRVACVGASITEGAFIEDKLHFSFPGQLQTLLGPDYLVSNYGVGGRTMLKKGDFPYWQTDQYRQALKSNPDMVIIDLGGNDSKLVNRFWLNEIDENCEEMIEAFQQLPSHPRVIVLLPVVSFVKDTAGISDPVIVRKVIPGLQQAAYAKGVEVLDMHQLLVNHEELMPDKIHPNKEGSAIMAKRLYELLVQEQDTAFDLFSDLPENGTVTSFAGYPCTDFTFEGKSCKVVRPKWSAKGHPWIWRARFWGHEPQTDIALLERGFHLVYCDVAELFGNQEAVRIWDGFYTMLHRAGLSEKAVMEGMSRGGVYVLNWAATNPSKVSAVYIDNPVLDLKSWPCGLGKAEPALAELAVFKRDYNITSDAQLKAFKNSPIDRTDEIVKGHYPILILCADDDEAVPPGENTIPFEQKIRAAAGNITVIHKPGFKHHPHSFPNPEPIVRFILENTISQK